MSRVILAVLALSVTLAPAAALAPAASFVHEDASGRLAILGKVAIVLTGDDAFVSRIAEDVLAITLMGHRIRVIYPAETHFGRPRDRVADPAGFARREGADVLITGTLVTEPGEHDRHGYERRSLRTSIASLSLVDLPRDKVLVWALYEPEPAAGVSRIGTAFVEFLVKSLE
ncbi:MAG TPA: hypothetical protein ENN51_08405 [candidate division WOR-3 bacterium]|uniref:Uncharacterized protein n=1 Tax=candidate division WOR-3 bacterium TaxID=2052148 RepID=A0A7V0T7J3_UNCW3|nr:hypothetical protein [candidate division WOR-3 bacterium]